MLKAEGWLGATFTLWGVGGPALFGRVLALVSLYLKPNGPDMILLTTDNMHFKGIAQNDPKMKIISLITHPRVVPNPSDLCSSSEHKLIYFYLLNQ